MPPCRSARSYCSSSCGSCWRQAERGARRWFRRRPRCGTRSSRCQITFLRTLPPLAYFSLLIIWLGINEAPKVTLLAVAAFPPVAVSTTTAVAAVPKNLIEAARTLGPSRWDVVKDVVVPSALPETLTGVRLAVGVAYSSLVTAELVNGLPGIGGMVKDAVNYNNTPVVLVGIIAIGVSGLVIDGLLLRLERAVVPWRGRA
jgi:taurine transport system permease protein